MCSGGRGKCEPSTLCTNPARCAYGALRTDWRCEYRISHSDGRKLTSSNERQHVIAQSLVSALNLSAIQCVQVPHRGYATALILDHSSGWRVVYSGDTKPSDKLARLGKDATVLIHEATIEDDKPEMADAKGHSTFGQAIDVGRK